jgi:hypothetical protein
VPYKVVDRRAGDTVAVWAATELAESLLSWKSKLDLADMCRDQWGWAQKYPQVYLVLRVFLLVALHGLPANWHLLLVVGERHLISGLGLVRSLNGLTIC